MSNDSRPKWWEIATDSDQIELFQLLARNPKFNWRKVSTVIQKLGWSTEKFQKIITPHLHNRMLLLKKGKNGQSIGYWEIVDADPCNGCDDKDCDDDNRLDPNLI